MSEAKEEANEVLSALTRRFPPEEVGVRFVETYPKREFCNSCKNRSEQVMVKPLPYVTRDVLAARLNEVLGPLGWSDTYTVADGLVACALSITIDGTSYTKSDGSGVESEVSPGASAFTDAFKRACAKHGLGAYLYTLEKEFPEFKKLEGFRNEEGVVFAVKESKATATRVIEDDYQFSLNPEVRVIVETMRLNGSEEDIDAAWKAQMSSENKDLLASASKNASLKGAVRRRLGSIKEALR